MTVYVVLSEPAVGGSSARQVLLPRYISMFALIGASAAAGSADDASVTVTSSFGEQNPHTWEKQISCVRAGRQGRAYCK